MTDSNFIATVLRGNQDAIRFLAIVTEALMLWDDLIDGDVDITVPHIHRTMWDALLELPANPFYREHFETLQSVLRLLVMEWVGATAIEHADQSDNDALMLAYADGKPWSGLLLMCSMLINGAQQTSIHAPAIRKFAFDGGFEKYLEALKAERAARQGHAKAA